MLSVAIFTYKRLPRLLRCLASLRSNSSIGEVLLFNDDETQPLSVELLGDARRGLPAVRLFNPQDFGFEGRAFRKLIYMNKAIQMAAHERILFSDDDGIFSPGAVDRHDAALAQHHFCAGAIVRDRLFGRISKSILQGTNYSFRRSLWNALGGYDETFVKSRGGGDVEFWYRIYHHCRTHNLATAYLPRAVQRVTAISTRTKKNRELDPQAYLCQKHNLHFEGPMYKWFPEIRNKKGWMHIVQ
jgi:hypothetical protein